MGNTARLAKLRSISTRWDAPETPRSRRHAFGLLVLGWLVAAAVVAAAVVWRESRLVWISAPLFGAAIGATFNAIRRHRRASRPGAQPQLLRPYQPTGTERDPWERRAP